MRQVQESATVLLVTVKTCTHSYIYIYCIMYIYIYLLFFALLLSYIMLRDPLHSRADSKHRLVSELQQRLHFTKDPTKVVDMGICTTNREL